MNGELIDLVEIASNAKSYLKDEYSCYIKSQYTEDMRFFIKTESTCLIEKDQKFMEVATTVNEWLKYLKNKNIKDVLLSFGKVESKDINLSAFANGISKWNIITKDSEGLSIAWYRRCYMDKYIDKWHVELYGMPVLINDLSIVKSMDGIKESIISSLTNIMELAVNIKEDSWAKFFQEAINKLVNKEFVLSSHLPRSYPELNHRLIETVSTGWCFGGMGSWNDTPPYSAHIAKLDDEFKRITEKLYSTYLKVIEATVNVY